MNIPDRFLQALAFLTVLPVGPKAGLVPVGLYDQARYFPLAGIVVGLLSGGVFVFASTIWTGVLPALFAIVASVIATGALHEDGLADTADGLGGGWTRDQRLAIMKDSRIGAYGALALILSLALRTCALNRLAPSIAVLVLIATHATARCAPVMVLALQDYAGDPSTAKMAYQPMRLAWTEVRFALVVTLLAMVPIFVVRPMATLFGIALGAALCLALALYSKKAIGGYCGDVLGAIEQIFEIGCLLGLAAG